MLLRLRHLAATALIAGPLLSLGAAPAAASCAASDPPSSPHAFTGVVLATSSRGRVATVRTQGSVVEVRGTPATGANEGTSVDRTYEVGGRYEFHPINTSPPWEDNACTATRLLGREPVPAASGMTATSETGGVVTAPMTMALSAVGLVTVVAVLGLLWWRRRASGPRPG